MPFNKLWDILAHERHWFWLGPEQDEHDESHFKHEAGMFEEIIADG